MSYKALLHNDDILIVNRNLARAIGLENSIFLRQIHYWMDLNHKAGKYDTHFKWDRWWTYNTYSEWVENDFIFWSEEIVGNVVRALEGLGLLNSTSRLNRSASDRTKWYSLNYDAYEAFMALWELHGKPNANARRTTKPDSDYNRYQTFLSVWEQQISKYELSYDSNTMDNKQSVNSHVHAVNSQPLYTETTPKINSNPYSLNLPENYTGSNKTTALEDEGGFKHDKFTYLEELIRTLSGSKKLKISVIEQLNAVQTWYNPDTKQHETTTMNTIYDDNIYFREWIESDCIPFMTNKLAHKDSKKISVPNIMKTIQNFGLFKDYLNKSFNKRQLQSKQEDIGNTFDDDQTY